MFSECRLVPVAERFGFLLGLVAPVQSPQDFRQAEAGEQRKPLHPSRRLVQLRLLSALPG